MAEPPDRATLLKRSFSSARRGFDRDEVEHFRTEVTAVVEELQGRIAQTEERLTQLGITELMDLKHEFDSVGADVRDILQAARTAAEDMRTRAGESAAHLMAEAQEQAEGLRGDAWDTSREMLDQVTAKVEELTAKAHEDVLFLKAEAERESLRLTGDARRDAEEMVRSARVESERLMMEARTESDDRAGAAQQAADLAQERVRALEARREELLGELEQLRANLTEIEDRIEGRRTELTHATTDPAESSVRVVTNEVEPKPEIGDWLDEDATVRLVTGMPAMPMRPVDADELAAEVESLRASPSEEGGAAELVSSSAGATMAFEITAGDAPAVADASATAELTAHPEPASIEEPPSPDVIAGVAPAEPEVEEAAPSAELEEEPAGIEEPAPPTEAAAGEEPEVEPEAEAEAAAEPEAEAAAEPDDQQPGIDDLFARLRHPEPEAEREAPAAALEDTPEVARASESLPERAAAAPDATATGAADAAEGQVPEPARGAAENQIAAAWDVRDRNLIPLTNEALRSVKRQIVDVQNAVLEELRTEPGEWRPKKAMFDAVLVAEAEAMPAASFSAGVAASGELAGRPAPALPDGSTHTLATLVTDLWEDAVDALEMSAGGDTRERGAGVSRIFRAWRADEAERRVRRVAYAEYNAGVAAGLEALGVAHVVVPSGRDLADPDATVVPAAGV